MHTFKFFLFYIFCSFLNFQIEKEYIILLIFNMII